MPTIESERPPINQQAIHVDADDFKDRIDSMGDKAFNQRFTVHTKGLSQSGDIQAAPSSETNEAITGREEEVRAPIDVSVDLQTVFTFGGVDNPARQQWLNDNGIKQGEDVVVRIEDQSGKLVERTVSTDPNTFFIPVDKLVQIETDEFEHAEIIPKKYALNQSVIVERNVYDADNKKTGEKTGDFEGWTVIGYGVKNGESSTKVGKLDGDQYLDKEYTNAELEAIQTKYSPESRRSPISAPEAHKMGRQELEAAGVIEPEPAEISVPEVVAEDKPETKQEKSAKDEIKELPIDAQRAIQEYVSLMYNADFFDKANGPGEDSRKDRQSADQRISGLPTAMKDLAPRLYKEEHPEFNSTN
ncbi:hypothetical protein EPN95_01415 [Patescibacteria group bacterium]|nr:MAG: hypothetical protein EPN95_01415 [Patescibacteria group bacterium]